MSLLTWGKWISLTWIRCALFSWCMCICYIKHERPKNDFISENKCWRLWHSCEVSCKTTTNLVTSSWQVYTDYSLTNMTNNNWLNILYRWYQSIKLICHLQTILADSIRSPTSKNIIPQNSTIFIRDFWFPDVGSLQTIPSLPGLVSTNPKSKTLNLVNLVEDPSCIRSPWSTVVLVQWFFPCGFSCPTAPWFSSFWKEIVAESWNIIDKAWENPSLLMLILFCFTLPWLLSSSSMNIFQLHLRHLRKQKQKRTNNGNPFPGPQEIRPS